MTESKKKHFVSVVSVTIFSFIYLFEALVRASEKLFWYDELITVYFSRLSPRSLWSALNSGVDFNPPLFYFLTKASESLFGEGPIGTRVPEIFGFWVFCVCLFVFVGRCAGYFAGTIAMLLPILTGAFYYAYEARPHAIVLGCCGLSLVFWQLANERLERKWLAGLSSSLFLAFMLHCYALLIAVPFACAGLVAPRFRRSVSFWMSLVLPGVIAVGMYLPLLFSYRKLTTGTPFAEWFPANWSQIESFYSFEFSAHPSVMFGVLGLLIADRIFRNKPGAGMPKKLPVENGVLVLALGFLLLPLFGIALAKLIHGPFFARYFQSALAGLSILLGLSLALSTPRRWMSMTVILLMTGILGADVARLSWHRYKGWPETLTEPSTGLVFRGTPSDPLVDDPLLNSQRSGDLPIEVLDPLKYLYYVYYAPDLAPRLYCAISSRDNISYRILRSLREKCGIVLNRETTYAEFRAAHPLFFVYGHLELMRELYALEGEDREVERLRLSGNDLGVTVAAPGFSIEPQSTRYKNIDRENSAGPDAIAR